MSDALIPRGDLALLDREEERWSSFLNKALDQFENTKIKDLPFFLRRKLAETLAYGRDVAEAMKTDVLVGWVQEMLRQPGWAMECSGDPKKGAFQRALLPYMERKLNETVKQAGGKPLPFPGWRAERRLTPEQRAHMERLTGQPEGPPNPPGSEQIRCPHGREWPCDGCYANGWDILPAPVAKELFLALRDAGRYPDPTRSELAPPATGHELF